MYMSDAGLLNTSGLLMTNRILLDFLMVILVTPWTGFKPNLDMAYMHIQQHVRRAAKKKHKLKVLSVRIVSTVIINSM